MTKKLKLSLFFLVVLFTFSTQFVKAQHSIQSFTDIVYKTNPLDTALTLDIFLPDSSPQKKYPVVVIIHGGGWVEGDKTLETIYYMQRLKSQLLANQFAVVSINYSLVGKDVHLPTPIEDCKDAVRWVRCHADEYHLDSSNIGLWGGSAGGHLALMVAYTSDAEFTGDKMLGAYSANVNYVIDNFGPTELNNLFRMDMGGFSTFLAKIFMRKIYDIREQLVFAMSGYHIKTDKQKIKELNGMYSPLQHVDETAVPTIIFHGTDDNVVPIAQSIELKAALDKYAIKNEMISVDKGDHGFNNISKEETNGLVDKVILFIKEQMR